ncbi:unnamed protein product [Blepharisma stoltei]|uniref:Mitogen-activated protein kinase n=1 Tax=Blepharisma stoltei TaxID=1481888 RepID=A0AAU9JXK8_9CILI|nr:unnamed protein product [Blepharisma stoltei]
MINTKLPNWEVGPRYRLVRRIGKGTYGSVCEAIDLQTNQRVAIKNVKALFDDVIEAKHMLREISIMRTLNHINIIKIVNIFTPSASQEFNNVYIVMEHAEADLKKLSKSPTYLEHNHIKHLMYQAVCGMRYMHSANVLHRDIKPANILINSNCTLKICDFGLSRSYRSLNQNFESQAENNMNEERDMNARGFQKGFKRILTGHVVTRWYRAPEVILLEKEYGKEMDVWSLGCVFAEMLQMIRENNQEFIERCPLFPGKSCFPLSPDLNTANMRAGYPCSESDQLNVIFQIIGTPSAEDLRFISDEKAIRYVQSFPFIPSKDLREYFPACTAEEIDLLQRLLTFSPHRRITLDQALQHPYFAMIRDPNLERLAETPADFIFDRDTDIDMQTLRDLFRREINRYNHI